MAEGVLTVWRDGSQLLITETGHETTDPGLAHHVILNPENGFAVNLVLRHGTYAFRLHAHDEDGREVATGAHSLKLPGQATLEIPLVSLLGKATLHPPKTVVAGELIDVTLSVHPHPDSPLIVPTSDFDVSWEIAGGNEELHLTSKLGARVRPADDCNSIRITASLTRAGETEPGITASITLAPELYCSDQHVSIADFFPPELSVEDVPDTISAGTTITVSDTANDAGSGMKSVRVFDGPILLATVPFPPAEDHWATDVTLNVRRTRTADLRVVATDNAGNQATQRTAITVVVGPAFTQVAAGSEHTCGIINGNVGYCWGFGFYNQLGTGTDARSHSSPTEVVTSPLSPGDYFTSIVTGHMFSCGLTSSGKTFCWGTSFRGELGDGNPDGPGHESPHPVDTTNLAPGERFTGLSAHFTHACGITDQGNAYCWGGGYGQLGTGNPGNEPAPARVASANFEQGEQMTGIGAGHSHTCAITDKGRIYCWGNNADGELGIDDTEPERSLTPVAVVTGARAADEYFRSLAVGFNHSCGITNQDSLYCWGSNSSGQLGIGTGHAAYAPARVSTEGLASGEKFKAVFAGMNHTCSISNLNHLYCWGYNEYGQLGTSDTVNRNVPTRVNTTEALEAGEYFTDLALGAEHTCGITNWYAAYCWGRNHRGQLGNGTNHTAWVPTRVDTPD